MYLTRNETMVPPGATADYEAFYERIGEFRKGKPGVIGQTLLRSYAYPGKYVLISRWESVEAAWDLQKTAGYLQVLKSVVGGGGGGSGGRPQEGYEDVFNVNADDRMDAQEYTCEVLHDFELDLARNAREFETNRRERAEVLKQHATGFGSYRLRRSMGNPTKYLGIGIWKDRGSFVAGGAAPEVQKFLAEHGGRQFLRTPQTMEAFAVLHRI